MNANISNTEGEVKEGEELRAFLAELDEMDGTSRRQVEIGRRYYAVGKFGWRPVRFRIRAFDVTGRGSTAGTWTGDLTLHCDDMANEESFDEEWEMARRLAETGDSKVECEWSECDLYPDREGARKAAGRNIEFRRFTVEGDLAALLAWGGMPIAERIDALGSAMKDVLQQIKDPDSPALEHLRDMLSAADETGVPESDIALRVLCEVRMMLNG